MRTEGLSNLTNNLLHNALTTFNFREFEELAISVVDRAFSSDFEKALLIVEQPYDVWGGYDCLLLATSASDKAN